MISPSRKPLLGRRLFSLTCFVEALLLVGLLVLLSQALRPDFGGGKFVLVTLFASIGLLLIATIRDVVTAIIADRNIVVSSTDTEVLRREWRVMLGGLALVVTLFGLILFFGTVLGMTVVALVILRWYIRIGYGPAFAGTVMLGLVVPIAFGAAIGMDLWPGLIPELMPGWLGGGLLPPL